MIRHARKPFDARGWVMTLTPIIVAMLALAQSGQAKRDGQVTAGSVATLQSDANIDAQYHRHLRERVATLERKVARLEAHRPVNRTLYETPRDVPGAEVTARSENPVWRFATAPVRWAVSLFSGRRHDDQPRSDSP